MSYAYDRRRKNIKRILAGKPTALQSGVWLTMTQTAYLDDPSKNSKTKLSFEVPK
jgi:hypothetical protein